MKKLTLVEKLDRKLAAYRRSYPEKPDAVLKWAVFLDRDPDDLDPAPDAPVLRVNPVK